MDNFEHLKKQILEYNPKADIKLIEKAYLFAEECHRGQKRESGEPYFNHILEVVKLLIGLKADSATLAAAFLHDCVEEANVKVEKIRQDFGEEITMLVEGVTKTDKINFETKEDYTAENLRKILLATTKDIRVMLIKLADRLHNMQTLKHFRPEKQKRISLETMEIYAPIAHKLGMWNIKGELEDLSFKYLIPEAHNFLKKKISEKREEREKKTEEFIDMIKKELKKKDIEAEVYGRAKYFYSIYKKMQKKKVDFNEIYDLIAIRIITKTIPDCYGALGIIHDLWKPMPGKFKDYIAVPKANGYQSLHTTVVGSHGKILEVQIRTEEMHHFAEEGIAAHWRYQGTERDKKFDRKISWLKQLLDWKRFSIDAKEFIETFKIDLWEKEIVVFTPKGDPITLPEGSTPVDFAFEVHTSIGKKCSKAMVNNRIVPLNHELKSGDIVEIIMTKDAKPSRQWLNFVKTNKAKSKIRSCLNITSDMDVKQRRESEKERDMMKEQRLENQIKIDGKKAQLKISKCCNPKYGDNIFGFYTKDGRITVHKKGCENISAIDRKKEIKVSWISKKPDTTILNLSIKDRVGILSDIMNVIAKYKISIKSVNTKESKENQINIFIEVETTDKETVNELIKMIKYIRDVIDVSEAKQKE